ncbi:quinone oxidoreductase family protein [Actinomadura harenae]|uniref:Zinc-binding alcohol dehydrogenase family protein n=1 Tax=Actinomadura harenae TaxID=2483351 RepID=A0A3M2LY36_9ACTN|nr:zinc-binding alcohol dehydrogenase family protein [Actinomadura harenae]RMI42319.1 zinc-binding alcohol dehydrogenase family protein [Actinomadura harenae]
MRKIRFEADATPVLEEAGVPQAGPGELLVRVEAVGVGLGLVRSMRSGTPATGAEVVGRVTGLGPGTSGFQVGDRVGGVVMRDAFADTVVAVPQLMSAVPEDVDTADALCLVRGGLIAMSALRAGAFAAGESVLVTGAASGVGHLAVQLAKAMGAARVVAAAGSPDKAAFLRDCGATEVVAYDQDWGEPVDVVLDGVGGDLVQRGVDALRPRGRLVAFSAGGGVVDAGSLLGGLKTVTGFSIGLIGREQPELIDGMRAELWRLLAPGDLRPAHTAFPFEDVDRAVALVAERRNLGRVLLEP